MRTMNQGHRSASWARTSNGGCTGFAPRTLRFDSLEDRVLLAVGLSITIKAPVDASAVQSPVPGSTPRVEGVAFEHASNTSAATMATDPCSSGAQLAPQASNAPNTSTSNTLEHAHLRDNEPVFSIGNAETTEGGTLSFTVTADPAPDVGCQMWWYTVDGSAGYGDYGRVVTAERVGFNANQTEAMIYVTTYDDTEVESTENMYVIICSPDMGTIGDDTGEGTIYDNDGERLQFAIPANPGAVRELPPANNLQPLTSDAAAALAAPGVRARSPVSPGVAAGNVPYLARGVPELQRPLAPTADHLFAEEGSDAQDWCEPDSALADDARLLALSARLM